MLDFAEKLKYYMKLRKISGQRIADAMGVSQKTISRYARGESTPGDEMQRKIFEAIAEIGGHPEDATFPFKLLPTKGLRQAKKWAEDHGLELSDGDDDWDDVGDEGLLWPYKYYPMASAVFSLLKEKNQKFVLDHLEVYGSLKFYEIEIIRSFTWLTETQQAFILKNLEIVRLEYEKIRVDPFTCKKISNYIRMISEYKSIVPEDLELVEAEVPESPDDTELMKRYRNLLIESYDESTYLLVNHLREMLFWGERDWYLLMLVNFLVLSDQGSNKTEGGEVLGDKVFGLTNYIRRLAEENIETFKKTGKFANKKQSRVVDWELII